MSLAVWEQIQSQYEAQVAHQFLLHLNVRDLVGHPAYGYLPMEDYLLFSICQLDRQEENDSIQWLVFSYDRVRGARFPERFRVRGNARADYQWKYGLNATLYKFAQWYAIQGNDRAALNALQALLLLEAGFKDCIRADTEPERPFARLKDNPALERLLNTDPIVRWREVNAGIRTAKTGITRDTPLLDVLNRLDSLLHANPYGRRVGVLIQDVELIAPNRHRASRFQEHSGVESAVLIQTLARWASDPEIRERRNLVLMTAENLADVAQELVEAPELCVLQVPFPDLQKRRAFLRHLAVLPEHWQPPPPPKSPEEERSEAYQKLLKEWPPYRQRTQVPDRLRYGEGFSQRDAAHRTAGLTLRGLYEAYLPVALRSGAVTRADLDAAKAREVARFSRGLLELVPPRVRREEVGGLRHVERYFSGLLPHLTEGRPGVPNGVWLFGPPGTGKTLTVSVLSSVAVLPVLRLKMPHELGIRPISPGLDPEDEYANNLHLTLHYALSIAPVILVLERVDETFSNDELRVERSVGSRALGLLLECMAIPETQGKILWLGLSSRPHRIHPRLLATPQMDALIYLLPTPQERAEILERLLRRSGLGVEGIPYGEMMRVPGAERFSGEDIATLVTRAVRRAVSAGRQAVRREDLQAALDEFTPEASPLELEYLSLQAARFATARSQLPDEILPPLSHLILEGGKVAKERIVRRIQELRSQLPEELRD